MADFALRGLFFQNARGLRFADSATVEWTFDSATNSISAEAAGGPGGGVAWGDITGTLADQTDLQTALDGKASSGHDHDADYEPLGAAAAAVAAVIDSAPGALDTLNELAAALGDDANYAATITTALAGKQPLDADLTALAAANNSTVLANTTASFTTADETKLDGIESGATADQSNAEIETAYNAQVSVVDQAEAEAGTATTVRRWTAERVKQAIEALAPAGSGDPLDAWPVGSIFIAAVSTSPATLLGGGTWEAFGAGRVLVGRDSGDTDFDTAEETGGAKTKAISAHAGTAVADHASHTHTYTEVPNHVHVMNGFPTATGGSTGFTRDTSMSGTPAATGLSTANPTGGVATGTTNGPNATLTHNVTQPNDHSALNVVQPYIVVYMWKRTA